MTDSEDEIERKLKEFNEAKEEQMARAASVDQQRLFEGFAVERVSTKFKGTVELEGIDALQPYEKIRFEGHGQVVEIRHQDEDGSLQRIQIIRPLDIAIIDRQLSVVE